MCQVPEPGQHFRYPLYVSLILFDPVFLINSPPRKVIDIIGTSSGKEGGLLVDFECSSALPCHDITATGTHLAPGTNSAEAVYYCKNVADVGKLDFDCVPPSY